MQPPETDYVDVGGVRLAYQVWGHGDLTIIGVPNWSSNTDAIGLMDSWVDFAGRLAHAARIILYDQRGTGLSDRVAPARTVEDALADLCAVVDHVGVDRVVLMSPDVSTPAALAFAATYPERTHSLLLMGPTVRVYTDGDYHVGLPAETAPVVTQMISDGWGRADSAYAFAGVPGEPGDDRSLDRAQIARVQRQAASRSDIDGLIDTWVRMDGREYVDRVQAPTLIVHRSGDQLVPISHAHWLAERLPNARLLELPGDIHYIWLADRPLVTREILEFLHQDASSEGERSLVALVVTDIADSTGRAAALGHEQWRTLLDRHNDAVRRCLRRFGGSERNTAGDSFVATFASAEDATRFAITAVEDAHAVGLAIRAGVHVGEVDDRDAQLHGLSVHVAARVQTSAQPGEVLVTTGTREALVGTTGLSFESVGERELRGVPGQWTLWSVAAV